MKLSQRGMVQLMSTDFEVPLFAVECAGGVVVKTPDSFHDGVGTTHWSREPYGVPTGDLRPSFMQAALIEKHHFELSNVMFFDIARVGRAASSQERQGCADEEHDGAHPSLRCACGMLEMGVRSNQRMFCWGSLNHHESRQSIRHACLLVGHERGETNSN